MQLVCTVTTSLGLKRRVILVYRLLCDDFRFKFVALQRTELRRKASLLLAERDFGRFAVISASVRWERGYVEEGSGVPVVEPVE